MDLFVIIIVILFFNLAFLAMLFRLSTWYNIRKEGYGYHLVCLNFAALLIFINEQISFFIDYPFIIKVIVALSIPYLALGLFKKRLTDFVNSLLGDSRK
ncbi:hypothetical protein EFA69_08680 [Rufibacter immobilis]|uniref:Uncharacterized protein n=1 Tax=Rufibacter immobilis TaxID=1348778 RepID=A0A3M9MXM3_9BACT|nr:hypothetical protein EFA69_08680 [Rufibacter immobilis]